MKATLILLTSAALLAAECSPTASTPSSTHTASSTHTESQVHMTKAAIKTVTSPYNFTETVTRAVAAINKRPLNVFAQVDHAAGAAKADLALAPSTLFIFGNPKGGTPLMSRNPQMGIVLPLKMHVYQDGDAVKVSYTDIAAEAKIHGLDSTRLPIPNIVKMLDELAKEVTTSE